MNNLRYNYGNYYIPEDVYGGIAVDVGCNNGSFLMNNLNIFQKIYAYEPNIKLFNLLTEEYKNIPHIEIFNNALSDKSGEKLFLVKNNYTDDDGSYGIYTEEREHIWSYENLVCDVESINLETIITNVGGKIDYLKVDCECGEYSGLLNKNLNNISYIGIEIHNQLGESKYTELFQHICVTHNIDRDCNYTFGINQEYFFKNKLL